MKLLKNKEFWRLLLYFLFLVFILSIIFTGSFIYYIFLLQRYPLYSADFWGWQYGPKEIVNYFEKVQSQYDDLYMAGEFNGANILIPFYSPEDCKKCSLGNFDNYNPNRKQLFAVTENYLSSFGSNIVFKVVYKVYYPDNKIAFVLGELKK